MTNLIRKTTHATDVETFGIVGFGFSAYSETMAHKQSEAAFTSSVKNYSTNSYSSSIQRHTDSI